MQLQIFRKASCQGNQERLQPQNTKKERRREGRKEGKKERRGREGRKLIGDR